MYCVRADRMALLPPSPVRFLSCGHQGGGPGRKPCDAWLLAGLYSRKRRMKRQSENPKQTSERYQEPELGRAERNRTKRIVNVPAIQQPIQPSPGFAKKQLSDFKLDIMALC